MNEKKIDFLIIGVQKGGTTSLDSYLRNHPEVEMAKVKEVHYFDKDNFEENLNYSEYHSYFNFKEGKINGESTPIYFYWEECIKRIKEYNKNIKLICILRNRIERAFSHWNMVTRNKKEIRTFKECIIEEINQIKKNTYSQDRVKSYVSRGLYFNQLKNLFHYFNKENILILDYEDYLLNQQKNLDKVCYFLNIKPFLDLKISKNFNKIPYLNSLNQDEVNILKEFYKEDITNTNKLIRFL